MSVTTFAQCKPLLTKKGLYPPLNGSLREIAQAIGAEFTIDVPDHPWQAWKSYPDGSVAYAAVGSASSTIEIARVMPCTD